MRLQAITICVHGAHLLSCTLSNRHQFDRWLIVTVPRDAETIELCRAHGMECVHSEILRPDGADLYHDDRLERVTAEGLAQLDQAGWAVILSEYVMLPRLFRQQVLAARLEPDCQYRLAGLRHCATRPVLDRLAMLEPWQPAPMAAIEEEPPFRMFALPGSAAPERIDRLAVTALTVSDHAARPSSTGGHADPRQSLLDWLRASGTWSTRNAMVAGYYPRMGLERLAGLFKSVHLQDRFGVHQPEPTAPVDAGWDALQHLWAVEMARIEPSIRSRLREPPPSDTDEISANSIDLLYLPGEVSSKTVLPSIPLWRRVLGPHAIVCGDLYGMADWPEATSTIAQLFGRPEVHATGFWWTRLTDAPMRQVPSAVASGRGKGSGSIVLSAGDASDEEVLLSLHSLRKEWDGPLVVEATRHDRALELQCALYGGEWRMGDQPGTAEPRLRVAAGTVLFGSIGRAEAIPGLDADNRGWSARPGLLQRLGLAEKPAALVRYQADRALWTRSAHVARHDMVAEMRRTLSPPIAAAAGSTVVTIVDPAALKTFEALWPRWVFDNVPVIIAYVGIGKAELDWVTAPSGAKRVKIQRSIAGSAARTLERIIERVKTKRIILLPPAAVPLPGAELFAGEHRSSDAIVLHSSVEVQSVAGVGPLPENKEPLAARIDVVLARDICGRPEAKRAGASLRALLHGAIRSGRAPWSTCNLKRQGWQLEPSRPATGAQ